MSSVYGIKNIDELESVVKDNIDEIVLVYPINERVMYMGESESLRVSKNVIDSFTFASVPMIDWLRTKIVNIGKTKEEKRWNNLELSIKSYYDVEVIDKEHIRLVKQKDIY